MRLKEIKPGMVIHCKTEEEANILAVELDKLGYSWVTGQKLPNDSVFKNHINICLFLRKTGKVTWCDFESEMVKKETVTEFSDLIIPELSAKEVLETIGDICGSFSGRCGSFCPLWGCCTTIEYKENNEKTIDICTKWREEHPKEENKELETEWLYVVRIIKVHDNGRKECVHEVDLKKNEQTGEYLFVDDFTDEQLKKYCSEHKGKFFAVYEQICRIKE